MTMTTHSLRGGLEPFRRSSRPGSPDRDHATIRRERKEEIVLGYRLLASWGWGDDGSGHITGRDPQHTDHFWLLRYGVAFGAATVGDLVLVDPDGHVVAGSSSDPDAEINPAAYNIHFPIHEARPDVMGAVHTHTAYGTPFSAMAAPLVAMSQESCAFHGNQAVFEGEELDVFDVNVGRRVAAALGPHRLLVMANHGLLTVGATVAEAVGFFVMAERAAEVHVKTLHRDVGAAKTSGTQAQRTSAGPWASPTARVVSDAAAAQTYSVVGTPLSGWQSFQWLIRSRLGVQDQP